jgi:hypothetical protein
MLTWCRVPPCSATIPLIGSCPLKQAAQFTSVANAQHEFYAPEVHIMYLTVASSFVMGGSGPSRVIKFLNAPERPEQGD